jgi:Tol biopolymer transport system component
MAGRAAVVAALGAFGIAAFAGSDADADALRDAPSAGRIVFASNRDDSLLTDVFAIGVDRYGRRNLTRTPRVRDFRAQPSPDGKRILFQRGFEGDGPILVMNRDGSGVRRVAFGNHYVWSPDGTRIAYDFRGETFVQDVDGNGASRVTSGFLPSWSPDGSRIAFLRPTGQGVQFFVANADGSGGERRLAPDLFYGGPVTAPPRWSPDGRQLAVQASELSGRTEVTVVDVETGAARRLAPGIQPRWAPGGSLIAFVVVEPGVEGGIAVVRPDGGARRLLVTRPARAMWGYDRPCWSPDGRRVALVRSGPLGEQVYVVGADGRGLRRVTREPPRTIFFQYEGPSWLDRETIVVSSHRIDADYELYTMRPDGTERRRLTRNHVDELEPVWSPDGRRIAFTRGAEGSSAIWVTTSDGRHPHRVSPRSAGGAVSPSWSPDGRRLAFAGVYRHGAALFLVNADGTGLTRVRGAPPGGTSGVSVDWSPDGTRLVYAWLPGPRQLFAISARGGRPRKLTRGQNESFGPRWSPDGRTIAFVRVSSCGGDCARLNVATVGAGGRGLRKLVENASDPSWSTDGRRLVFVLNGRIATAARDGSHPRILTRGGKDIDRTPDWGPP